MLINEPTIYRYKGDRWRGQLLVGYDEFGKAIRKSAIGDTKKEVREKLLALQEDHQESNNSDNYTVASWLKVWLETYKKNSLEETSYLVYERLIRNHLINSEIGAYKLDEITTLDIQIEYNKMFNDREKYSKRTIETIHAKLNAALKKAVDVGIISSNPCIGVEMPKGRHSKKITALSVSEMQKLVERCEQEEYANIFIFLLATGLRIGEACGLTWDNVDLKNKEIHVKKIMVEVHGNPEFKEYAKTDAGIRTIPLNSKAYEVLCARKKENDKWNVLNLVFFSRTYNFRTTANLRRYFNRICKEAEIPAINLHCLRHTYATRMIENNCNMKVLSNLLGHKKISTTLDIYSDALLKYKKEQVSNIDFF